MFPGSYVPQHYIAHYKNLRFSPALYSLNIAWTIMGLGLGGRVRVERGSGWVVELELRG